MTQHSAGSDQLLETVELEPQDDAAGTVIWLHGLGADANDFEPIVPMLTLNQPLRFVFPNAPVRPVTIHNLHGEAITWLMPANGANNNGQSVK